MQRGVLDGEMHSRTVRCPQRFLQDIKFRVRTGDAPQVFNQGGCQQKDIDYSRVHNQCPFADCQREDIDYARAY